MATSPHPVVRFMNLMFYKKEVTNKFYDLLNSGNVAIIVAHPDDETIGCGSLLNRVKNVKVCVLTNGIMSKQFDKNKVRFIDISDENNRLRELEASLSIIKINQSDIFCLGFNDLALCSNLCQVILDVEKFIIEKKIKYIITHAFEGGHPDHDATAFCVRTAVNKCNVINPITVFEMPLYHFFKGKIRTQYFCDGNQGIVIYNDLSARIIKSKMLSVYKSQAHILKDFRILDERFRLARNYNFLELPNQGKLFYSTWNCPFTGDMWINKIKSII
jgi:LmbE family N-acetylglucosaminyl deacetylase